ncbi:MAG: glycosyltransferase 87 family protein [Candidatus Methanomethylophilaceae archaeon]
MRPFDGMDDCLKGQVRKFTIIFVIAAAIFYTAFQLSGIASEVGTLYFRYAEAMVDLKMPYSGFDAEYPPFAMLLILIPRLFSFSPFTYQIAFGAEVYLFLLAGLICVHRMAACYTNRPSSYSNLYIVLCIILLDFILDRYDVLPMVMCIVALYFVKTDRMNLAWVMIALGTVTKLYPALLAPVLLIHLISKKDYSGAVKGIGICLAIGCLSMLPFLIADPGTMFMFLTYHMDRGMQTEAVVSSFLMLFGYFGMVDIGYVFSYGSDNITGAVPDAVASGILYVTIVMIVVTYAAYAYIINRRKDEDMFPMFSMTCFLVVMLFMLVGKVLSSQYLVWIIPFVVIAAVLLSEGTYGRSVRLFVESIVLTQANMIVNYAFRDAGEPFSLPGILILVVRNVLLLVLLWVIVRYLVVRRDPASELKLRGRDKPVEE